MANTTKTPTEFETKLAAVEELCETAIEGDTNLDDWMRAGNWQTMSVAEIAAEWDALSDDE